MRDAFVKTIYQLAKENENIMLLICDVGSWLHRQFRSDLPDRFINIGISEQNAIGISAGLSMCGKIPYVYGIPAFIIGRAFDQIKIDLCSQNLNVKLIGIGCGLEYSMWGPTHHALEDIALLRSLPNMQIYSPADAIETREIIKYISEETNPCYVRITKTSTEIHSDEVKYESTPEIVKSGTDGYIISTGRMVYNSLQATKELKGDFGVINISTLKPLDTEFIKKVVDGVDNIFTVEEHSIYGGLGSMIAEILVEKKQMKTFKRIGVSSFCKIYGSIDYIDDQMGLSPRKIAKEIQKCLTK